MNKTIWKDVVPGILVVIMIYIFVYPHITELFSYDIWEKIKPDNKKYSIHASYYFYIISSFILLGYTVLQTFIDKAHWSMKLLIASILILFTIPLFITQSIFVLDDTKNEKMQNEKIETNKDSYLSLEEELKKINLILSNQEKLIIQLRNQLNQKNNKISEINMYKIRE